MMQKMAQMGNTYYIFDENGDGMSFSNMGIHTGNVSLSRMMFALRNINDIQVISVLGVIGSHRCDVYFDGESGVSNMSCSEVIGRARKLNGLMAIPFRVRRDSSKGLLQVILAVRPNSLSREEVGKYLGVSHWRITR